VTTGRRRLARWQRLSVTCACVTTVAALTAVACADGDGPAQRQSESLRPAVAPTTAAPTPAPGRTTRPPVRARNAASAPLPGMPPIANATNIYADAGPNMLSQAVSGVPYRIYVPNSEGSSVDVINPYTMQVIRQFPTGLNPQHVVPAYDMKRLYVTNDRANSLTPIDPHTARRAGPNIPVADPYNMYFTPNGRYAIVVAEAQQHLDFRDPHTFALRHRLSVSCPGVDHVDFAANGGYLIATCEFSGRLVKVNLHTMSVVGYLQLPGGSPQDIKLDPTGRVFYVADRYRGGVWLIRASTFRRMGFIPTGRDAHGLYPSRDARYLYVTNRGAGSVSVISFAKRTVVKVWHIPGGGSPDMGNTSPDGKVLWLAGRYNSTVYAISTQDGHLIGKIAVGAQPHGLCVWPQPGRYSLGHTGVTR
jgi:DNA-binding beta-propeller fold protein YncE